MGTDIHMWAEILEDKRDEWQTVGRVFKNEWYREGTVPTVIRFDDGEEWEPRSSPLSVHPYSGRNYELFAILADVRNGYGFAGVDTGDGWTPITSPRGIPDDVSEYMKWEFDHNLEHTPGWLTLQELADYDWLGSRTRKRGWVGREEYARFKSEGQPQSWSGFVSGGGVRHISNEEMESEPMDAKSVYTQVEWENSAYECCRGFVDETIPALQAIANTEGVRDLRIVFYFDS